jgi:hypothetical protein
VLQVLQQGAQERLQISRGIAAGRRTVAGAAASGLLDAAKQIVEIALQGAELELLRCQMRWIAAESGFATGFRHCRRRWCCCLSLLLVAAGLLDFSAANRSCMKVCMACIGFWVVPVLLTLSSVTIVIWRRRWHAGKRSITAVARAIAATAGRGRLQGNTQLA